MLAISKSEQRAILKRISELPDEFWLSNHCFTDAQKKHWHECKQIFQMLQQLLKAYFSGNEFPFPELEGRDREYLIEQRDYYIGLYAVIHDAWAAIKQKAHELGIKEFPTNPGAMLILILEWKSKGMMWQCCSDSSPTYATWSPTKERKLYQEKRKLDKSLALVEPNSSSHQELQERVKEFNSKVALKESLVFSAYRDFCLQICSEVAKKDPALRRKLRSLRINMAEIDRELISFIHPSRKPKGHTWVNGYKRPLTSK